MGLGLGYMPYYEGMGQGVPVLSGSFETGCARGEGGGAGLGVKVTVAFTPTLCPRLRKQVVGFVDIQSS